MLAGSPSIVFALFGTLIFQSARSAFLSRTNDGVVYGRSFFAAAAMLSLIALPLIVANVREGLQAIPGHVREASYAVGKTKIATTRRVLLPAARPSVVTGRDARRRPRHRRHGDHRAAARRDAALQRRPATIPAARHAARAPAARSRPTSTRTPRRARPTSRRRRTRPASCCSSMVLVLNFAVDVAARRGKALEMRV